jgi:hypothetical protein
MPGVTMARRTARTSRARFGLDPVFEVLMAVDRSFERALDRSRGANLAQVDVLLR